MKRSTTFSLFLIACFLQGNTYGLIFLLPPLFADFGGTPVDVGDVLTATTISILLVILYSGKITQRLGLVNTIAFAGILLAASLVIIGAANNVGGGLFIAGSLLGFGWGMFYTLTPIAIDTVIKPDERVKFYTLLSISVMAGFGSSPVIGVEVEKITNSLASTFYIVALYCLISTVIFMLLKKPLRKLKLRQAVDITQATKKQNISKVLRSRALVLIIMIAINSSIFVCMTNYQALFAQQAGLNYAHFFLTYTTVVVLCRILLVQFMGGRSPYATIAVLLLFMIAGVALFLLLLLFFVGNAVIYIASAILFGVGYGAAYPILKAMAANEAEKGLLPQTMQAFGLSYFLFLFGFPFIAGRIIVNLGPVPLLQFALLLGIIQCVMAIRRALEK